MTTPDRPKDLSELLALLSNLGQEGSHDRLVEFRLKLHAHIRKTLKPKDRLRQFFDSEDLTQDVWIFVSQRVGQFQGETWSDFYRFVYGLVAQKQTDMARSAFRQKRGGGSIPRTLDTEPASDDSRSPASTLVQAESVEQVRTALRSLPENYRVPLQLYIFEGLKGPEIAERLQITQAAARQRLKRALDMLRADVSRGS